MAGVGQVQRVVGETTGAGKKPHAVRYFVTSLTRGETGTQWRLEIMRGLGES